MLQHQSAEVLGEQSSTDRERRPVMQPHQQRVVDEKTDLDAKRDRLRSFVGGDTYRTLDQAEQSRLNRQLEAMTLYSNILEERITAFTG